VAEAFGPWHHAVLDHHKQRHPKCVRVFSILMRDNTFVIVSILVCVTLLTLYDAFIRNFDSHQPLSSENQWSQNIVNAQEIIYQPATPHTILVGTSLSARLAPEMFSGDVFNLAFADKSTFDGLRILELTNRVPNLILVETNYLIHSEDPNFINQLFREPGHTLRHHIPVLLERHRPFNQLRLAIQLITLAITDGIESAISYWGRKIGYNQPDKKSVVTHQSLLSSEIDPLFDGLVDMRAAKLAVLPSEEKTKRTIHKLEQMVRSLEVRGSVIVFFEVPMHPRVCNAAGFIQMRQAVAAAFPEDHYTRLPPPDCSKYKTTDGIHLRIDDAQRYASYLYNELFSQGVKIGGEPLIYSTSEISD